MFKVFGTEKVRFILILLFIIAGVVTFLSEYAAYYKLNKLEEEKVLATTVYELGRADLDLASIQYRGKDALLRYQSDALVELFNYDYIAQYLLKSTYPDELSKLLEAIERFSDAAEKWYAPIELSEEELQTRKSDFSKRYDALLKQIGIVEAANYRYEKDRFVLEMSVLGLLFILIMFSYYMRPARPAEEMEESKSTRSETSEPNPAYIDAVSEINNLKGFLHEYNGNKNQKLGNYSAVCVFSIDKLETIEVQFSKELTRSIIQKVGFMLSLYRQHSDVIGRIDHNQFVIFLSRQDKTSAINDCELIRKSVEETPFKSPNGSKINITLSGGFVQKLSTQNIEEILTKAKKVLALSVQHGGNRIAQLRDKSTALK